MTGIVSTFQDIPENLPIGSIYLIQDTNSLVIYNGNDRELVSQRDSANIKYTKEELDYTSNVKPFLNYAKGEFVRDNVDLVRGILKAERRSESSRFLLFD